MIFKLKAFKLSKSFANFIKCNRKRVFFSEKYILSSNALLEISLLCKSVGIYITLAILTGFSPEIPSL